ncbi:aromatase/cyclase [Streptomyces sp. 4N509B]|uniref:aromatase/cyclase n=1 Tax=Streptomyces sp. 4N509B TaxID=3457413 RepID=UPI003FD29373
MDTTTTQSPTRSAEHTTELAAPAERAYALVEDVRRWPLLFSPCIWSQELERTADSQRIRLWAVAGHEVRSWVSRREIDAERLRIEFRQETPAPPVAEMSGFWQFENTPYGGPAHLLLNHSWATVGDSPDVSDRIAEALHANSTAEIKAIRTWAERPQGVDELMFSFSDRVLIAAPPAEVYDFLYRADLWPERLPHVARLDLETSPADAGTGGAEVQTMDMDTAAADGTLHTTQSVRLCFADERIVYKQTTPPRGLLAHSGDWALTGMTDGTLVTARHSVAIDPAAMTEVFGEGTSMTAAKNAIRAALGGNSRRTLEAARAHTEAGA